MATDWITLVAGGAGGTVLTALYSTASTRAAWRREDRHRFAATKLEVYGRLAQLAHQTAQLWVAFEGIEAQVRERPDERISQAHRSALDEAPRLATELMRTGHEAMMLAEPPTMDAISAMLVALTAEDRLPSVMLAQTGDFIDAARAEMGVSSRVGRAPRFGR